MSDRKIGLSGNAQGLVSSVRQADGYWRKYGSTWGQATIISK